MRRIVLFLAALAGLVLLNGCAVDDLFGSDELAWTVWENTGDKYTVTLSFSAAMCEMTYSNANGSVSDMFSYEYNDNVVTLTPDADDVASLQGTVNGNKMEVVNMSNNKSIGTFTKQ